MAGRRANRWGGMVADWIVTYFAFNSAQHGPTTTRDAALLE